MQPPNPHIDGLQHSSKTNLRRQSLSFLNPQFKFAVFAPDLRPAVQKCQTLLALDRRKEQAPMVRRQSIVLALAVSWTLIGMVAISAQEPVDPPQPGPEHKKLRVFVGTGRTKRSSSQVRSGPVEG